MRIADSYARDQMRIAKEIRWIEKLIRRSGIQIGSAENRLSTTGFRRELHQRTNRVSFGDCMSWGAEQFQEDSRLGSAMSLITECVPEARRLYRPLVRMATFKLETGDRPDMRFYITGCPVEGTMHWVAAIFRHPQLSVRLSSKERRLNKPFHLKNGESRYMTRSEAKEAIRHLASAFFQGFRPNVMSDLDAPT